MAQQTKGVFFRLTVDEHKSLARKARAAGGYPALIRTYLLSADEGTASHIQTDLAKAEQTHQQQETARDQQRLLAHIESVLCALLHKAEAHFGPADYMQCMLALSAIARLLRELQDHRAR